MKGETPDPVSAVFHGSRKEEKTQRHREREVEETVKRLDNLTMKSSIFLLRTSDQA